MRLKCWVVSAKIEPENHNLGSSISGGLYFTDSPDYPGQTIPWRHNANFGGLGLQDVEEAYNDSFGWLYGGLDLRLFGPQYTEVEDWAVALSDLDGMPPRLENDDGYVWHHGPVVSKFRWGGDEGYAWLDPLAFQLQSEVSARRRTVQSFLVMMETQETDSVKVAGKITFTFKPGDTLAHAASDVTDNLAGVFVSEDTNTVYLDPRVPLNNMVVKKFTAVFLVPAELYSDLDNHGKVTSMDADLATLPYKASSEVDKDKGTEFIFVNDTLSNGAWDREETGAPAGSDDDDAEQIHANPGIKDGEVWFDHPAIAGLRFYRDAACTRPLALSGGGHLQIKTEDQEPPIEFPPELYIRVNGSALNFPPENPQIAGDLKLMIKPEGSTDAFEAAKMKLTVVKQMGAKKFFQATRDYILENNTELFIQNWGYPVASPSTFIRMCVMREEATTMSPYESYWNDAKTNYDQSNPQPGYPFDPVKYAEGLGIEGVMNVDTSMTVVINGNQCGFSDGTTTADAYLMFLLGEPVMTDKCQGRLVIEGILNPASNDHYNPNTNAPGTQFKGSYLAGPDPIPGTSNPGGKYLMQKPDGKFAVGAGQVPLSPMPSAAVGGLSTNYALGERSYYPNSMLCFVPMSESGKGVVFAACGISFTQGNGKVVEFYDAAKQSDVPMIAGATSAESQTPSNLVLLDSGNTSPGLAHKVPSGSLKLVLKGSKHEGNAYYTNTFVRFKSQKPRTSP